MPQSPNVAGMVADPDFQGLAPMDKRAALGKLTGDQSFSSLSDAETMQFVSRFAAPTQAPPQTPGANQITGMSAAPKNAMDFSSPASIGSSLAKPVTDYLQQAQNLTPEGAAASPIKNLIGKAAGFLVGGNQGIGTEKGGILTNPVTGSLIGLGPGESAAATLAGKIPSAERAGASINAIVSGAKDLKVPLYDANAAALRAKEIADAGTTLPKPARDFLRRILNPDRPPVTLEEARDFYTGASKITAKEWGEFSGPMKKQFATFTKAIGDNIESALNAATPGQGTALRSAMDEYHSAMALKAGGIKALKAAGAALGATALGSAAYSGWKLMKAITP